MHVKPIFPLLPKKTIALTIIRDVLCKKQFKIHKHVVINNEISLTFGRTQVYTQKVTECYLVEYSNETESYEAVVYPFIYKIVKISYHTCKVVVINKYTIFGIL